MKVKIVSLAVDIQGTDEQITKFLEFLARQDEVASYQVVNEEETEVPDEPVEKAE